MAMDHEELELETRAGGAAARGASRPRRRGSADTPILVDGQLGLRAGGRAGRGSARRTTMSYQASTFCSYVWSHWRDEARDVRVGAGAAMLVAVRAHQQSDDEHKDTQYHEHDRGPGGWIRFALGHLRGAAVKEAGPNDLRAPTRARGESDHAAAHVGVRAHHHDGEHEHEDANEHIDQVRDTQEEREEASRELRATAVLIVVAHVCCARVGGGRCGAIKTLRN